MADLEKVRVDRWLWSVRAFKTRTAATEACEAGRVRVGGESVKPAHRLAVGDTVEVRHGGGLVRVYEAVKLIDKRVGAPVAAECYLDHSPPPPPRRDPLADVWDPSLAEAPPARRERGAGRPTKRERRDLDSLRGRRPS